MVLDNLQGICPKSEEQAALIDTVKSERISKWLIEKVESDQEGIVMCGICRHFSQIHPYLLDVGILDNLIEIKPPSKEQRYNILKESFAPSEEFARTKEVKLQNMAQLTEYFMTKDLYWLKSELSHSVIAEEDFEESFR